MEADNGDHGGDDGDALRETGDDGVEEERWVREECEEEKEPFLSKMVRRPSPFIVFFG